MNKGDSKEMATGGDKILITGGTGFFGKSILDWRLRHPGFMDGAEFTILSRAPGAFVAACPRLADQAGVSFVAGDIRTFDFSTLHPFDALIHAATSAVTTLSDDEMRSTIVEGTRNVVSFAKGGGAGKLLFVSSGAVYGPQTASVGETAACSPVTAYGMGKLEAERLCLESGVPTPIARCFAFVGPYLNRRIHYAIGNFIQDCLDGKDIVIKGDGTPLRSYLHADDLVEWLFAILERGEPGRAYNVGSPEAISIGDLAARVRRVLGAKGEVRILGRPEGGPPSVYVPKVDRAREELGLEVRIGLDDAIRRSVAV